MSTVFQSAFLGFVKTFAVTAGNFANLIKQRHALIAQLHTETTITLIRRHTQVLSILYFQHLFSHLLNRTFQGVPLKSHYGISLTNAQTSLEQSTNGCTNLLPLSTNRADCQLLLTFDITDEIRQLELDLAFLNYIQSEASDNLEQFLSTLSNYHEMKTDVFNEEVDQVFTLLKQADHFKVLQFFLVRFVCLKLFSDLVLFH